MGERHLILKYGPGDSLDSFSDRIIAATVEAVIVAWNRLRSGVVWLLVKRAMEEGRERFCYSGKYF